MEEKQKVQVVFEFDRSEYDAYLFLMNQKKTEEVEQVWNAMIGERVVADIDLLEEDSLSVKLMMISLAILSVEKKVKGGYGTGSNQFRPVLCIVQQTALSGRSGGIQKTNRAAVHVEPDRQSEGNDGQGV